MMPSKRAAARFSLLLLDDNEFYIREFVAICTWPSDVRGNWQGKPTITGQLRLCTKSLFFEADDIRIPIVRLPFIHMEQLEGVGKQGISIVSQRWIKMKANAADEPYTFEKGRLTPWTFQLTYAALSDFMPLAQQMLVASRLPPRDQDSFLENFVLDLRKDMRFDLGHLHSPSLENIILELPAMLLTPLIKEPGCLAITPSRLYFQPLHNISGNNAVRSHTLHNVAAVARRRSELRDIGLEIFFIESMSTMSSSSGSGTAYTSHQAEHQQSILHRTSSSSSSISQPISPSSPSSLPLSSSSSSSWGSSSAFFAFYGAEDRDTFFAAIMKQESLGKSLPGGSSDASTCCCILEAGGGWLARVMRAWQRGAISNYEYLLYCNIAAGRSFNDLTQYPIFPWVLTDYTSKTLDVNDPSIYRDLSKPIGALNPARLRQYKERYHEMTLDPEGDPPFLYGTHYSCPGYTLFWLVRSCPAHMLRLQNGRFDAPDRLFHDVASAWDSVLANHTDVKELIPEFYMSERCDFLINQRRLAFGVRQDGRVVSDVELPPWSQGSPQKFLKVQRAALESPHVSAQLHLWIDLIFGYKQRGQAAVDADNVFRHLTYEGAVDLSNISDRVEKMAIEVAINEFGQCPKQLYHRPHPPRCVQTYMDLSIEGTPQAATKLDDSSHHDREHNNHLRSNIHAVPSTVFGEDSLSLALVAAIVASSASTTDKNDDIPGCAPGESPSLGEETPSDHHQNDDDNTSSNLTDNGAVGELHQCSPTTKNIMGRFGAIRNALGEVAAKHMTPKSPAAVHAVSKLSSLAESLSSRWQTLAKGNAGGGVDHQSSSVLKGPSDVDARSALPRERDTVSADEQAQEDALHVVDDKQATFVCQAPSPFAWKVSLLSPAAKSQLNTNTANSVDDDAK